MSHFDRRKAELELQNHKGGVRQPRAYRQRKPRAIRLAATDADVLHFIASRLHSAGLHNFAAELERIANAGHPDDLLRALHERAAIASRHGTPAEHLAALAWIREEIETHSRTECLQQVHSIRPGHDAQESRAVEPVAGGEAPTNSVKQRGG